MISARKASIFRRARQTAISVIVRRQCRCSRRRDIPFHSIVVVILKHSSNESGKTSSPRLKFFPRENLHYRSKVTNYLLSPTCRRAPSSRSRAPITAPLPVETFVVGGRATASVGNPRNPLCTTASSPEAPSSNLCPNTIPAPSPTRSARSVRSNIRSLIRNEEQETSYILKINSSIHSVPFRSVSFRFVSKEQSFEKFPLYLTRMPNCYRTTRSKTIAPWPAN